MTQNYLLFSFMIYSIAGWLMESIYRSIIEKKIINSGFLHGPCCPIYGFGAIFLILLFSNIKNPIWLFILGFVTLTLWEYLVGVLLEKIFHTKYWDYSEERININGRVCLKNSVYWGILTVIFILIIHPTIAGLIYKIPEEVLTNINIILYSILLIDTIISSLKIHSINKHIEKLKTINTDIKDRLGKLKQDAQNMLIDTSYTMYNNLEIDKLVKEYNKISLKLYKQLMRLIKAFPTIKSEKINKFLNNKIDISYLKEKIKEVKNRIKNSKNIGK